MNFERVELRIELFLFRLVSVDRFFEIIVFLAFAEEWTCFLQRYELLLSIGELVHVEIKLTEVFVGAAMI